MDVVYSNITYIFLQLNTGNFHFRTRCFEMQADPVPCSASVLIRFRSKMLPLWKLSGTKISTDTEDGTGCLNLDFLL